MADQMSEGGQRARATASALQVHPPSVFMKLRCHQRSPCHSDELFPQDTLTGLARGGPFKGPESGTKSAIAAVITGLCVIIAVMAELRPYSGPIMGAAFGRQKQAHT